MDYIHRLYQRRKLPEYWNTIELSISAMTSNWASNLNFMFSISGMRPILKFGARGKGTFMFRKSLKVLKNAICDMERDRGNLEGEFVIRMLISGAS